MIRQRLLLCFAVGAVTWVALWNAEAQTPACRYYKVQANSANVSKEGRADAVFIDLLDKGEVVCVTREQNRDWLYIPYKIPKPGERAAVEGWVGRTLLQQLTSAEIAAATGTAAPPGAGPAFSASPSAPPNPSVAPSMSAAPSMNVAPSANMPPPPAVASGSQDDVLRYSRPVPFGAYPVIGNSIEQLANGIPQFPPFDGLDEATWKKNCSACHKWDRSALCAQGASYAKNPRSALRLPHPYGGAYKSALMQWAKSGCQ